MPTWVYDQGHIGWALFAALVYTGIFALVVDYLWRRVTISFQWLAIGSFLTWLIGLGLISFAL